MATLKQLLDALHESPELSSAEALKSACELIIEVQAMDGAERDCIRASYKHGPLFDGDVPSKSARDRLLGKGYMAKVVVKGDDGYNACTHKGAWAHRLLREDVMEMTAGVCTERLLALVHQMYAAVSADRCDGDSEFASGVNAACDRHKAGLYALMAAAGVV